MSDPPAIIATGTVPLASRGIDMRAGFVSERGARPDNQDFGCVLLEPKPGMVIAVIADGVGGALGGRVAAELSVRSFLEGFLDQPESATLETRVIQALAASNRWVHRQAQRDPELDGMATTITLLVIQDRAALCAHVGDTRLYRLCAGRVAQVTIDHVVDRTGMRHVLRRAIGLKDMLEADIHAVPLAAGDRFLLCSDGIHGALPAARLMQILLLPVTPDEVCRVLTQEALAAGSQDNVTAIVLDVLELPPPDSERAVASALSLPILALPKPGEVVDRYRIGSLLSDRRYSRIFTATDGDDGRTVVIKFPKALVGEDQRFRRNFIRETVVSALVSSPWLGVPIDPGGRRSRLYSVVPFYEGETLAVRLRRFPHIRLAEGVAIAIKLAKGVAALHQRGIIHRDIKPDNIILEPGGGLKLIDFGTVRLSGEDDGQAWELAGTSSYLAPELFAGGSADRASDLYALGVTLYSAFSAGAFPYGEVEPFMRPQFGAPTPVTRHRADLPSWLDAALLRLVAADPARRFADVMEFLLVLEQGQSLVAPPPPRRVPLYQRNPARFWQGVSVILAAALWLALAYR